jgi:hypothetical protein
VFIEYRKEGLVGPLYFHVWNCTLDAGSQLVTGMVDPDRGTSSLAYMHEPCKIEGGDADNVLLSKDPCSFHLVNAKECPPSSILQVPWTTERTINATPLIALNHSGSCIKLERIQGGATFHMLLAVTADKWEISLIHLISPAIPLKLS